MTLVLQLKILTYLDYVDTLQKLLPLQKITLSVVKLLQPIFGLAQSKIQILLQTTHLQPITDLLDKDGFGMEQYKHHFLQELVKVL
jgi:hypothetical protein